MSSYGFVVLANPPTGGKKMKRWLRQVAAIQHLHVCILHYMYRVTENVWVTEGLSTLSASDSCLHSYIE